MSQILTQILVSFLVTGVAKAQTTLKGTKWLVAVNVGVALIQSAVVAWNGGSPSEIEAVATVAVNTIWTAGGAYLVHKLIKLGYKQ